MKKYITPRIFVEKMGVSLLIQTSTIPVNTKEPKDLDSKGYFYGIDADDADEDWGQESKLVFFGKQISSKNKTVNS